MDPHDRNEPLTDNWGGYLRSDSSTYVPRITGSVRESTGTVTWANEALPEPKPRTGKPYRCPVCDGRGLVPWNPNDPYGAPLTLQSLWNCPPCDGSGVLWSDA